MVPIFIALSVVAVAVSNVIVVVVVSRATGSPPAYNRCSKR